MEKKVYLWVSLIVGVPAIRLVEVYSVGRISSTLTTDYLIGHGTLGLIIGTGCALAAQILNLTSKKALWVLPLLALLYASLLLGVTYRAEFFRMDPSFVSTLLALDLTSWMIAVAGAAFIGHVAMKPKTPRHPPGLQTHP